MTDTILANGRIIKAVGGRFWVDNGTEVAICSARGIIQLESELIVGDIVSYDANLVIKSYQPRKNHFIRPLSANIDTLIIVCAVSPAPDYLLIDKLIVSALVNNVDVLIAVNKDDLTRSVDIYNTVYCEYSEDVLAVVKMSAAKRDISEIIPYLSGRLVCLAGQSAVGKSSIINSLIPGLEQETGGVSKIERGRHTTRHSEIFKHEYDGYLLDTPGFSKLEVDIPASELNLYYADFVRLKDGCKFSSCTHINEPGCAVKAAVSGGKISAARYERYKQLYCELDCKRRW